MHFFVDGYNFIKSNDFFTFDDTPIITALELVETYLEDQEKKLVTFIFDGNSPPYALSLELPQNIQCLFSHAITADEKIYQLIKHHTNTNELCIITNDRKIVVEATRAGCTTQNCQKFFQRITT